MSEENVGRVREVLEAIGQFDLSRLTDLTDPAVEWRSFFAMFQAGEYHGHDGIAQYIDDIRGAFEVLRPEADDLLDVGDVVIAVGRICYEGKESGVEAEAEAGWVFKFRSGKLLLFRAFKDPAEVLEAVGRPE
jgi:ketosteroid isomerase-like protein